MIKYIIENMISRSILTFYFILVINNDLTGQQATNAFSSICNQCLCSHLSLSFSLFLSLSHFLALYVSNTPKRSRHFSRRIAAVQHFSCYLPHTAVRCALNYSLDSMTAQTDIVR